MAVLTRAGASKRRSRPELGSERLPSLSSLGRADRYQDTANEWAAQLIADRYGVSMPIARLIAALQNMEGSND